MRLLVHRDIRSTEYRHWLRDAFAICVRELGIGSQDATVTFQIKDTPVSMLGAATNNNIKPGRVVEMIMGTRAASSGPHRAESLAHEMTHVRQIITGRLATDQTRRALIWDGVTYPHEKIDMLMQQVTEDQSSGAASFKTYQQLPWEEEAWREGRRIGGILLRELGRK